MTSKLPKDELLVAWVQMSHQRVLVELLGAPHWQVEGSYLENWRRPRWVVLCSDPDPGYQTNVCGVTQYDVRDLHPMTKAARDLLRVREGRPRSPFITPELP